MRLSKSIICISILIAVVAFSSCQKKAEQQPSEEISVIGSVLSPDSVMISYEVHGRGTPALVFVHGWCCNRTFWNNQVDFFSQTEKVVTLDLAGHGQSGANREEWTLPAFGADVAAVVNDLELDSVILIGHSMGGPVIAEAAKLLPGKVLGLIGVDTFHDLAKIYTKEEIDPSTAPLRDNFDEAMATWVWRMFPAGADSALVQYVITEAYKSSREMALGIFDWYPNLRLAETLQELNLPLITINTDLWPMNDEGNKAILPNMEVIMMPGLGHFLMLEDPPAFNRNLAQAVQKLSNPPPAEEQ
jgi:pimeloyl-ACP methyl ester carboxylesterase